MSSLARFGLSLVCIATATALSASPSKPTAKQEPSYIVGGSAAMQGDYPFMGALFENGGHVCGASLITPNIALTAAHCVATSSPSSLALWFNITNLNERTDGDRIGVNTISIHPGFNFGYELNHDIALLYLDKNVTNVTPVSLAQNSQFNAMLEDDLLTVMGWGATSEGGSGTNQLMEVAVPYISNQTCNGADILNNDVSDVMFCAGYLAGGKDSCSGDSGGPIIQLVNNAPVQFGVVSWGIGCAKENKPGVYSHVAKLLNWVNSEVYKVGFSHSDSLSYVESPISENYTVSFINNSENSVTLSGISVNQQQVTNQSCTSGALASKSNCDISISLDAQTSSLNLAATLTSGPVTKVEQSISLKPIERFALDMTALVNSPNDVIWSSGGDQPWFQTPLSSQGDSAVRSGDIQDTESNEQSHGYEQSVLLATVNNPHYVSMSFDYLVTSEANYDFLFVQHNGVTKLATSGVVTNLFRSFSIDLSQTADRISFIYSKDGTTSNGGDRAIIDNVQFVWQNKAPQAAISASTLSPRKGETVVLDASSSSDYENDTLSYAWYFLGNKIGSAEQLTLTPNANEGETLNYTLEVTDQYGAINQQSVLLTVTANQAPVANIVSSKLNLSAGESFTLDAATSQDPEGDALSYSWQADPSSGFTLTSAAKQTLVAPNVTTATNYTFTVTVSDNFGGSNAKSVTVSVSPKVEAKSGSGGVLSGLASLFACLLAIGARRNKHVKIITKHAVND